MSSASENMAILIGRVGKDPEVRSTSKGSISSFSLATSITTADQAGQKHEQTEWHNIKSFGKTAEFVQRYIQKGQSLYVRGMIHYGSYTSNDGHKVYTTDIVTNTIRILYNPQQNGVNNANAGMRVDEEVVTKEPEENEDLPF